MQLGREAWRVEGEKAAGALWGAVTHQEVRKCCVWPASEVPTPTHTHRLSENKANAVVSMPQPTRGAPAVHSYCKVLLTTHIHLQDPVARHTVGSRGLAGGG